MEIRRAVDALRRCQNSPLSTYLTQSLSTPPTAISSSCRATPKRSIERKFTSSTRRSVRLPPPITTSASVPAAPGDDDKRDVRKEFNTIYNSPFGRRSGASQGSELQRRVNGGSSNTDLMNVWGGNLPSNESPFRDLMPFHKDGKSDTSLAETVIEVKRERPVMRLTPSTGRTVEVKGKVELSRAFALLSMACATNRVRQDFAKQRFYERPGMKRKRLKSERWRRMFKDGFMAALKRVQVLKKQGW